MKIEILGTGCHKCVLLESLVDEVLIELGKKDTEVIRISDEHVIRRYMPIDDIPGLVINGVLASTNTVPDHQTLKEWLAK
jgi:hypothetical protein